MILIPGHKAELYCLAAEEARELCIPIVTMGIGWLAERVQHEITGFIADNQNDFANYGLNLFNNDNLWKKIRNNLIKRKNSRTWEIVAKELVKQIWWNKKEIYIKVLKKIWEKVLEDYFGFFIQILNTNI